MHLPLPLPLPLPIPLSLTLSIHLTLPLPLPLSLTLPIPLPLLLPLPIPQSALASASSDDTTGGVGGDPNAYWYTIESFDDSTRVDDFILSCELADLTVYIPDICTCLWQPGTMRTQY